MQRTMVSGHGRASWENLLLTPVQCLILFCVQAAELCGANVDREQAYPGWQPAPESKIVQASIAGS